MLYWLLFVKLQHYVAPFRIFRYVTFRTAFASLTALFTALIVGPLVIGRLREFQIGQYIREEGPKAHQAKAGTPTMGGLLIVIAIIVPTLLWADLSNRFVWIAVFSTCAYAAIGFSDDYTKVTHRRNLGLTARAKLGLQIATSIVIAAPARVPSSSASCPATMCFVSWSAATAARPTAVRPSHCKGPAPSGRSATETGVSTPNFRSGLLNRGAQRYQILVPSFTVMFAFFLVLTVGWVFVAERFAVGLFIGGILPTANALIGRLVPAEERGLVFGTTATASLFGAFVGPLMGGSVAAALGLRAVFAATAGLLALTWIWAWRTAHDPEAAI